MQTPSRKGILIVFLIIFLGVTVAVVPDIISEEMRAWCKDTFGDGYQRYLLAFFVVGSVALIILTTDIGKWLSFGNSASLAGIERYNIPPGPRSRQILEQAKAAIAIAEPSEALRSLSNLKLPALNTEIDLLGSRLVEYQRTRRYAVKSSNSENRIINRISLDTRDLITTLEKELATGTKDFDTIRGYLKKRYNNRLDQKLAKRQPVNLKRIPSTEGTSQERAATFVAYSSEEIGGTMADVFREGRGRLLLLGIPGSGKTTLMIQLVLELLDSEPDSMPVLLNLATWSKNFVTLENWLKKILPAELGVNGRLASEIILQNRLILLLDGLDEVKEDERESCIEAIKRYSEDNTRQYSISSRIEEYKQIAKDAPVENQIEVGPLSLNQLEAELQRLWSDPLNPERGARLLWNAIQENELLRKVVETPFYFNALQILFGGGNNWTELRIKADSIEEMEDYIIIRLVQYELDGAREKYPAEKSSHWLSFLASRMNQRNMVVFELSDLQYDWWRWNKLENFQANYVYCFTQSTSTIPVLIPAFILIDFSIIGLFFFSFILLIANQAFSLFYGLFASIKDKSVFIHGVEFINWSWGNYYKSIIKRLKIIKIFAPLSGLVFGLIYGMSSGLLNGLFVGLTFSLVISLLVGLVDLMTTASPITQISSPYHRFIASIKALDFPIIQHNHLCFLLRKKGLLPYDLVLFLNEMSLRHILEFDGDPATGKGGGAWRFRHRILQEYFAEKWVEPKPK